MINKLLTEHHLDFLSLKGGCTSSSESTHVKMPHCWKSHATAHYYFSKSENILTHILSVYTSCSFQPKVTVTSCFVYNYLV